jgi:antitoxin component YwqK of YwqJK toxin-antitoxin module
MLRYIIILSALLLCSCRGQNEVITYYENSKAIRSIGQEKNNRRYGEWKFFYPSGKIKSIENYVEDMPVGEHIEYYESGEVKVKGAFSPDKFIEETEKETSENNEVVEVTYKRGCRIGTWEFYDEQGNVTKKTYKDCKESLQE